MKKKILIIDNCLRLWNEIAGEFGKTVDKKFIPDNETEIYKKGFMRVENDNIELYITSELQTGKKLIEMQIFDVYFLDNQIYDSYTSEKILCQKELVDLIINKNSNALQFIYNISTHENNNGLNRCPKRGRDIITAIIGSDYEK